MRKQRWNDIRGTSPINKAASQGLSYCDNTAQYSLNQQGYQKICIKLKAFDELLLDKALQELVLGLKKVANNCRAISPPTRMFNNAVIHSRLLEITKPTEATMKVLKNHILPNGVKVEINGVKVEINGVKVEINGVKVEIKVVRNNGR